VPVTLAPAKFTITPGATVAIVINAALFEAVSNNTSLPQGFLDLAKLSPVARANALAQLAGEAGTAVAPAGIQAMNSFLRLVLNPFAGDRLVDFIDEPVEPETIVFKDPVTPRSPNNLFFDSQVRGPSGAPEPRRWSIWGAAYGGHSTVDGSVFAGSHKRSVRNLGIAAGLDYLITPNTVVGFALGGGRTDFGLANGFGGGSSNMIQTAAYSFTRFGAAYFSTAIAYAGHWIETDRKLTFADDRLSADFFANNLGARVEGGYRFELPGLGSTQFGLTPYAALQGQAFWTPSYRESSSGSSPFALAYHGRQTDVVRTEIGAWFDHTIPLENAALALRARGAWARDHYFSGPATVAVEFQSLPDSRFKVKGAEPATDFALLSVGASVKFKDGWSFDARFDGEWGFHSREVKSQAFAGMGTLRYTW
jgi:outer membrane autotransporter protein